jgi:hypothetical protein
MNSANYIRLLNEPINRIGNVGVNIPVEEIVYPPKPNLPDFPTNVDFSRITDVEAALSDGRLKPEHLKQAMYATMLAGDNVPILQLLESHGAPTNLTEYNLSLFTECDNERFSCGAWFMERNFPLIDSQDPSFQKRLSAFLSVGHGTYFTPLIFYPVITNNLELFEKYLYVNPNLYVMGLFIRDGKVYDMSLFDRAVEFSGPIPSTISYYGVSSGSRAALYSFISLENFEILHASLDGKNKAYLALHGRVDLARTIIDKYEVDIFLLVKHPRTGSFGSIFGETIFNEDISNAVKKEILWAIHEAQYGRFDASFVYTGAKGDPMFSQRGSTCASDALFTMLFENDVFGPLLRSTNFDSMIKPSDKVLGKYLQALKLAKQRYVRMFADPRRFTNTSSSSGYALPGRRRALSINNDIGNSVMQSLLLEDTCVSGLSTAETREFIKKILVENVLSMPGMPKLFLKKEFEMDEDSIDFDNLIFIDIGTKAFKEGYSSGHATGILQKAGRWYFIDNEIGFLHEFQDIDWLKRVFIPRLIFSTKIDSASQDYITLRAFFYLCEDFNSSFLDYQFITFGEKFYPNVMPSEKFSRENIRVPNTLTFIFKEPSESSSAGAGAGAGVSKGRTVLNYMMNTRRGGAHRRRRRQTRRAAKRNKKDMTR